MAGGGGEKRKEVKRSEEKGKEKGIHTKKRSGMVPGTRRRGDRDVITGALN